MIPVRSRIAGPAADAVAVTDHDHTGTKRVDHAIASDRQRRIAPYGPPSPSPTVEPPGLS